MNEEDLKSLDNNELMEVLATLETLNEHLDEKEKEVLENEN